MLSLLCAGCITYLDGRSFAVIECRFAGKATRAMILPREDRSSSGPMTTPRLRKPAVSSLSCVRPLMLCPKNTSGWYTIFLNILAPALGQHLIRKCIRGKAHNEYLAIPRIFRHTYTHLSVQILGENICPDVQNAFPSTSLVHCLMGHGNRSVPFQLPTPHGGEPQCSIWRGVPCVWSSIGSRPYVPSSLCGLDADSHPRIQVQPSIDTGFASLGG